MTPQDTLWTAAARIDPSAPLAVLHSAGRGPWSTRSMVAQGEGVLRITRNGAAWIGEAPHPAGMPPTDPIEALNWADSARRFALHIDGAPAAGGWIAVLHYELGELLEPAVCTGTGPPDDPDAPLADLLWCPNVLCFAPDETPGGEPLEQRSTLRSDPTAVIHTETIERTVEYICAGDIFQANLTRRLSVDVHGDAIAWAQHAITSSHALFGAMIRLPGHDGGPSRIVTSMSPELFVDVDTDGIITSRPIKGTADAQDAVESLEASVKDAAELHMIVDLVRNDLGRICQRGSVRVHAARAMETHTTVHHGVADVRGHLRSDVGLVDLLRATFPPGSVTGAPKIRAMQIIRELETRPRQAYCGAIGLLGTNGATMLSVAIRTAVLHGQLDGHIFTGVLDYGTGGGITAQSDAMKEVRETELKAQALRNSLRSTMPSDAAADHPADPALHEAVAATPCVDATHSR